MIFRSSRVFDPVAFIDPRLRDAFHLCLLPLGFHQGKQRCVPRRLVFLQYSFRLEEFVCVCFYSSIFLSLVNYIYLAETILAVCAHADFLISISLFLSHTISQLSCKANWILSNVIRHFLFIYLCILIFIIFPSFLIRHLSLSGALLPLSCGYIFLRPGLYIASSFLHTRRWETVVAMNCHFPFPRYTASCL